MISLNRKITILPGLVTLGVLAGLYVAISVSPILGVIVGIAIPVFGRMLEKKIDSLSQKKTEEKVLQKREQRRLQEQKSEQPNSKTVHSYQSVAPEPTPTRNESLQKPQIAQPMNTQQPVPTFSPPYRNNQCCICQMSLDAGYATLFTMRNGQEARICENCYGALDALLKSNDRQLVNQAGSYIESKFNTTPAEVSQYIQPYLQTGLSFINSSQMTRS